MTNRISFACLFSSPRVLVLLVPLVVSFQCGTRAETILFESGMLGQTEISGQDVFDQAVLGSNVGSDSFIGARFHVDQHIELTGAGGHFVLAPASLGSTFFGAIVSLDNSTDFPDSSDLSTPDLVTSSIAEIPDYSANVLFDLNGKLDPGWYAVIFGSGLFGADGSGAALRNNTPIGTPDHIGFGKGFGWGLRPNDLHMQVFGKPIPEPCGLSLALGCTAVLNVLLLRRHLCNDRKYSQLSIRHGHKDIELL